MALRRLCLIRYSVLLAVSQLLIAGAQQTIQDGSWLDQSLANWNEPRAGASEIPSALPQVDSAASPADCAEQERQPADAAEQSLADKGWKLYGPVRRYGSTAVIMAMSGMDGMCRPLGFQVFVFSKQRFAGTLSPVPMNSRTDGALSTIRLVNATRLTAEFLRYLKSDALCCPSSVSKVEYKVMSGKVPTVITRHVETRSTAMKDSR